MDGSVKESEVAQRRTTLEDLNKEDLVKKCKNLLVIAQKAKQAKDEATEEVKCLKEQLNTLQLKYEKADNEEQGESMWKEKAKQLENKVSTMEEMLSSLTEQKLHYTMEVDNLKKQNVSLDKQLSQFQIDEANLRESSAKLQAKVEELETAAESYKRQNNRLFDENETLIQQLEALETEMKKKEEFSGSNSNQLKELQAEAQILRDELDCIKQEDTRKKEQMKQLYENFSKEKIELERKLEEEQNKRNVQVQHLTEELKIFPMEKERLLTDIKCVKKNNNELQKLVESVSSERDVIIQQCKKLNEERKIKEDKVQLLETEKKTLVNLNMHLDEEKCHLNDLVDNYHKEINSLRHENDLLKAEKQELNETLHSSLHERENLNLEVERAECQLLNVLCQLQKSKTVQLDSTIPDKQSRSLNNLISLLNTKLAEALVCDTCSTEKVEKSYCQKEIENDLNLNEKCKGIEIEVKHMNDVNLEARNYFTKLYTEITLLESVISNLETLSENLHFENLELEKSINVLRKDNLNIQTKIMPILDGICKKNACVCCNKVMQITRELENCRNNLDLKRVEKGSTTSKCDNLENIKQFSEIEEELRKELNHCRQCLSQKHAELQLVQEELDFVLGKQKQFAGFQRKNIKDKCKETLASQEEKELEVDKLREQVLELQEKERSLQLENCKLVTDKQDLNSVIGNLTSTVNDLREEVDKLNTGLKSVQNELLKCIEDKTGLKNDKLKACNEEVNSEKELAILNEELMMKDKSIKEKCTEVDFLKDKLSLCMANEADMNIMVENMKREVVELKKQLDDTSLILGTYSSEIQIFNGKTEENKELQECIFNLRKEIGRNSVMIQNKDTELDIMTTENIKLTKEKTELEATLEVKSTLIVEKEVEIESMNKSLKCINESLEIVKGDLEEKTLKFENDTQNLRFLLDEKTIELNSAKDEIENIKENFVIVSKAKFSEMSGKDKEIETLSSTLLKAESNLAETLVKLSETEAEYISLQNLSESLKEKISELNINLQEKECEVARLSSEIDNISKISQGVLPEIEELKNELKQCQLDRIKVETNLKDQLCESKDSYKDCMGKCDSLKIHNEKLQNDFKTLEYSYTEKTKELEDQSEKLQILQSKFHNLQEQLRISSDQTNEIRSEVCGLKKKLELSNLENKKLEEDLRIARTSYDNKVKEVENLSSELVNVENASAEALSRVTAITKELNSVKDTNVNSNIKFDELTEEVKNVSDNLRMKEVALQEKLLELEESKKSYEILNLTTENTKGGLEMIVLRIAELKDVHSKLSDDVKSLRTSVLGSFHEDIWIQIQKIIESFIRAQITLIKKENIELLGEMNEMNQALKQRGETISKLKEMNNEQDQQLKECNIKIEEIQMELESKNLELESKASSLCNLEVSHAKLKESHKESLLMKDETIKCLEKEISKFKECQHELETKTSSIEAKEESIHNLEAKLTENLQELETKNKVIFHLEKEIEKLQTADKEKNEGIERNVTDEKLKIKDLQEKVSSQKTRIQVLEREAEEIRRDNGDAPSEVMSSSTISRADESARLKDLDETFEERYAKLRTVAVRLKKKVSELTAQLTQLEADKKKLATDKSDLQTKVTQLSAHAKNLQTVQHEYDRLQDELESQKDEVKQLTKTLEAAINESATIKVQLEECQHEKENKSKDLEICSKDKQNLEAANRDLTSQIQTLRKEKDAENSAKKEKEKEIMKLQEEIKTMEKKLIDEVDHHKSTQEELENKKQECKKRSVLSLEMEDYEKSVADLTQQLTAEKSKVKELDSNLETQRDISRGLQDQISLLEQRIQSEEARSKEVKDQLNASRIKLSELEALAQEREVVIFELTSQIEHHRDKSENLVLQLSELAAEKQRLIESGKSQQDGLARQVHVLEEYISRLKESLAERETELGDLRAEFGNYKVRAQSVLRQKARPEEATSTFNREDCIEELSQLRQTADILRNKLEDASSKLQTLTLENNAVQEDRARVLQRCQELVDTVQDLRCQNSQLQAQLEEMAADHHEALKSQKLQADTLNQCYKQQLEELEERLQKETTLLRKQLEAAEKQIHGLEQQSSPLADNSAMQLSISKDTRVMLSSPSSSQWNNNVAGFIPVSPAGMNQQENESRLEISMLEREEGEGSESVDSVSPHLSTSQEHRTELVPLDKLLSTPSEDEVKASSTTGGSPSSEVGRMKEQVVMSECRIRHLTGLLSEAERDLAKLTQQNQVLKEEIRRQERSVEREQHAQNFEYLKNVVLKFVTLQGGDERSRLVPVLNTILKLSPEETNQLNIVANGGQDLQGAGKGWSSYLSLWSGTQST